MKLVITESQYDRVFNKTKTKLVITEAQYNKLLLESNMTNTISKITDGDAIKLIDKSGNELFFKVLDAFSGHILMVNCNDGVMKNNFYFMTSNSLNKNNLQLQFRHLKNIKDSSTVKGIMADRKDWANTTFKEIKSFKVFEGAGKDLTCSISPSVKPKFDVDLDSGAIKEPEEDETSEPKNNEESTVSGLISDLLNLKRDTNYNFELEDGSDLDLLVTGKGGDTISFEIMDAVGTEGDRYKELIGDTIEFKGDPKNINVKFEEGSEDDGVIKNMDIKFKRYLGGAEDGEEAKTKSEDFIIYDVVDFEPSSLKDSGNGFEGLSDDEIEEYFKKFINNSSIIRNALWKKPNMFLELFGVAKERGILPAEERLGKWLRTATNNSKILKDFKTGSEKVFEFTQFDLTNRDIKKLPMIQNKNYKSKVRKRGKGDVYPTLGTNFTDSKDNNFFKYSIDIKEELEDGDNFKIYKVLLKYRESVDKNFKDIGEGKIKVNKPKEKKDNI